MRSIRKPIATRRTVWRTSYGWHVGQWEDAPKLTKRQSDQRQEAHVTLSGRRVSFRELTVAVSAILKWPSDQNKHLPKHQLNCHGVESVFTVPNFTHRFKGSNPWDGQVRFLPDGFPSPSVKLHNYDPSISDNPPTWCSFPTRCTPSRAVLLPSRPRSAAGEHLQGEAQHRKLQAHMVGHMPPPLPSR